MSTLRQETLAPCRRAQVLLCAAAVSVLLLFPSSGAAAGAPPADIEAEAEYARVAVTLDGEVLFTVRGLQAYPAERRAKAIEGRLRSVAADRSVPVASLRVVEKPYGADILAGERFLLSVIEADGAHEGVQPQYLAQAIRQRLAEAIAAYRAERTAGAVLLKIAAALGATLVAGLLLWGVRRGFRWALGAVERRAQERIAGLEARSFQLIQARQLTAALRGMVWALRLLAGAAVVYGYLHLVLGLFPWSRPLARRLAVLVVDPIANMGVAMLDAVPNLIFIAILIAVVRYGLKPLRLFFAGLQSGTIALAGFDPDWAGPTYRILRFLAIAFAVVVAYPYIPGSDSRAFQGVSIFIGIMFSLGSSSFIANLIAGYSLTYRRTFRLGDRIRIGEVMGDVAEIGLMVTRLRTTKNEEVVVPNSTVLSSNVVNYSTHAKRRGLILHTTVGIGYETPWRQVEAMLKLAAGRTPGLLADPAPFVHQKALGDFCVTYELNAYCDTPQAMGPLYAELHRNILDVFNEYGVQIMTPAYEGDPEQPKVVPKEQWFLAPARPPEPGPTAGLTGGGQA
jgi:small-conductance mechanosensitive channel